MAAQNRSAAIAYAHSKNARGERQELVAHLIRVADLAAAFATDLGAPELGRYLGLWHDLGKFLPEWQRYLLESEADPKSRRRGPDHKAAGAELALAKGLGGLALILQAHHGGLTTATDFSDWLGGLDRATHRRRKDLAARALTLARVAVDQIEPRGTISLPAFLLAEAKDPFALEMLVRLLFSALVDADSLDTAAHKKGVPVDSLVRSYDLNDLWERFAADQDAKMRDAAPTPLNARRRQIYDACLDAAKQAPGLFRLSVPTGGGKTRSGLAFALRHAIEHGQRRIIVAVPYISITEQTAEEYRTIFRGLGDADGVVLEHHSGADVERQPEPDVEEDPEGERQVHTSAENWDAPLVVTTTVQLFESLFANQRGRCQKLHNLAKSVIILDEAQALPPGLLKPILSALGDLCAHYGTTVVLSTATQPAFEAVSELSTIRLIIKEPEPLYHDLKRVSYDWRIDAPMSWDEVAALMLEEPQALAVVNTKKDALLLLDALEAWGETGALHLSTLLCGAHRRQLIEDVKKRLKSGEPVRLVSTQCIEAGVDLDFPLVLRAIGPLDSIIQAAGRCNREGRPKKGRCVIFEPAEAGMPRGAYSLAVGLARTFVGRYRDRPDGGPDLDNPEIVRDYFREFYALTPNDVKDIQKLRSELLYPQVARRFRMIDDDTVSVVVDYVNPKKPEERKEVDEAIDLLKSHQGPTRKLLAKIRPYTVALRRHVAEREKAQIQEIVPGLGRWTGHRYDPKRGLVLDGPDAEQLVV